MTAARLLLQAVVADAAVAAPSAEFDVARFEPLHLPLRLVRSDAGEEQSGRLQFPAHLASAHALFSTQCLRLRGSCVFCITPTRFCT